MADCPSEADLRRYWARELEARDERRMQGHLAVCAACAERAAVLRTEHDTWVTRIREAGSPRMAEGEAARASVPAPNIAGYRLEAEHRRGGQGVVFYGRETATGREVAVKVLREGPYATPETRRRFEREIDLAAGLHHPHIAAVLDSGTMPDGRQYVVMAFVRGRTLAAYLADVPDRASILRLFARMAAAVQYAHQRGVIHRDLKPSNVLVDEAGEPHILDFGLARAVPPGGIATETSTGLLAGTLPYIAPEQARGLPDAVDVRGDVYALGVMLYEALTGEFPYPVEGDTLAVLRHIAETPPGRLSRAGGDGGDAIADSDLETVVHRTLAKDRERRYQSAQELALDLERCLAGEPIGAQRDSSWYVLRATLRRYRIGLGLAAAFVVLLAVSALALGLMYARQSRLRTEAEHQRTLAIAAEQRAQERFDQVRELARFFTIELDPMIARLPGAAPARRTLVTRGLAYLDALAADTADNRTLMFELAAAYLAIGDVQGDMSTSSLNDVRAAAVSYRKSLDLLEDLAEQAPDDVRGKRMGLLAQLKAADAAGNLGDGEKAMVGYRAAIAAGEQYLREHPDDLSLRQHGATACARLGNTLLRRGQTVEARALFEKSVAAAAKPEDVPDTDFAALHDLFAARTQFGQLEYKEGRLAEARARYGEALAIAQRLLAAHPDNIVARRDLGIAHQWLGIVHAARGDCGAALDSFASCLAAFEAFSQSDPGSAVAREGMATSCIKAGEAQLACGSHAAAEATFMRGVVAAEELTAIDPHRGVFARLLGVLHYKLYEADLAAAEDPALDADVRGMRHAAACDHLERCSAVFLDMRERGLLASGDADVPETLRAEWDACRAGGSPAPGEDVAAPEMP